MRNIIALSKGLVLVPPPDVAHMRRSGEVAFAAFVTVRDVATALRLTMARASKLGLTLFPEWWPDLSAKQLQKAAFAPVHEIILTFDEAKRFADARKRTATLVDGRPPHTHPPPHRIDEGFACNGAVCTVVGCAAMCDGQCFRSSRRASSLQPGPSVRRI